MSVPRPGKHCEVAARGLGGSYGMLDALSEMHDVKDNFVVMEVALVVPTH